MGSKVLIIIATGEKAKALTGLMYARNAKQNNWLEDVKIVFFGPSERLMVEDDEVAKEVEAIATQGETFACKFISDTEGVSDDIARLGVHVEYVGTIISNFIKDGYVPMVW